MSTEIIHKNIECPGCKQKIDVELERNSPKVVIQESNTETIKENNTHEHTHEVPKPEDPHKLLAESMTKGVNFGKCTGEDCGKKIKNAKGIVTKFKTCTNCKANTVPKSKTYCPTCGMDEKEDEPFEDSDVELEEKEEDGD